MIKLFISHVGPAVALLLFGSDLGAGAMAAGHVYYVAPNGNDANPGTEALPWRTIGKAANALTAGDTVYIRAGTYQERVLPQHSGSPGNEITYAAYPGPCCDWDIRGQELDLTGKRVGDVVIISQTVDDETHPRVVARPGPQRDYLVVWQRETAMGSEIWARRWGEPGVQDEYLQVAAAAWWDHAKPAVALAGPRYLFAYEADSQADPTQFRHIYGRQWTPYVEFLPAVLKRW